MFRRESCAGLAILLSFWAASQSPAEEQERDVQTLAARIDQRLAEAWRADNVKPTTGAADAEFMRRLYLDLAGRIPSVQEARDFLADARPEKRRALVERLLHSPAHVNHFAAVWRAALIPQSRVDVQFQSASADMEAWLRPRVKANLGYDRLVRELLTAPLPYEESRRGTRADPVGDPTPIAFYQANDLKAETLAGSTTRLFLGQRLECAQCHNHPFASWTREQFWQTAVFFAAVPPETARAAGAAPTLTIPGTKRIVNALFLDGKSPGNDLPADGRRALADWITATDNPYFARASANRIWAMFFGVGLVDPLDDFGEHNPPSHPELLDDLAREFAAHQFDVDFLVRAITTTQAYQRTSAADDPNQADPRRFARMPVKGMSPEQLFDSLALATGYRDPVPGTQRPLFGLSADSPRGAFLAKFVGGDQRTDMQTSILQALTLMNGEFIGRLTDPEKGEMLAAIAAAPFLDDVGRIEALYLATLSRLPAPEERRRALRLVEKGDPKKGLADLFWALLNSPEFLLNH